MTHHFMIFTVSQQRYGIALEDIREIITYTGFTKMPDSRPWVVGLVETRGQAMPIIDLRIRFETDLNPVYHDKSVIVATRLASGKLLGLVVDSVEDISGFDDDAVLSSEGIDGQLNSRLLQGYIQNAGGSILLLNHEAFALLNEEQHLINNLEAGDDNE